jgi:enoyl-CoA hydratase/carnithine racemase
VKNPFVQVEILDTLANIDPIEAARYATVMYGLLNKIENLEKPAIAAING